MGTTPLHRLNRVEMRNTLTDLFGPSAAAALPSGVDPRVQGVDSNAAVLTVTESGVDGFVQMAEAVAKAAPLPACASGASERACAQTRLNDIGMRVLRRPVRDDDVTSLLALWDDVRTREPADAAFRAVLTRLLLSPDFLYHVELGDPATGRLDDYEMAARLSYLAWESMPDAALFEAARQGTLRTRAGVESALARLFADPRGAATMQRFGESWADIDALASVVKNEAAYPGFAALRAPLREEFRRFVGDLLESQGTVAQLFTAPYTFANDALARLYGVSGGGTDFARVALDPGVRAGVLTQGAFLALHGKADKSAPILRGAFLRERVLCAPVPPPPPGASTVPSDVKVTSTTRAYFAQLTAPEACAGCHAELNPLGFAFEGFDGQGRARQTENGAAIDTSGALTAGDQKGPVSGAVELASKLGRSETVRRCLATHWFRSRFRRADSGGDAGIIDALAGGIKADGDRLRGLTKALAQIEALFYVHARTNAEGKP